MNMTIKKFNMMYTMSNFPVFKFSFISPFLDKFQQVSLFYFHM
jgi:hypothetical protein